MVPWPTISTVLLDMDGTLLDLHYDNHFWRVHVPQRYAEKNGLTAAVAQDLLATRFKRAEGTLDWYSVDYWTHELGLDIALLKSEIQHLIAIHPHVNKFLDSLRAQKKRVVLVTNAHGKSLYLKLGRTRLGGHFDAIVCAHDLGLPKEHIEFWTRMQQTQPFTKDTTLFIDDSLPVLRSAHRYGIAHLLAIRRPDSQGQDKDVGEFDAINGFHEIMP
ncbi:MAG: GMP/IMP nucleotidase [Pseudomonadota bacterium]